MDSIKNNAACLAFCLVAAAILSYHFLKEAPPAFPLDDAYIHLTYARNLADGHGFAFNKGEPSFGTTSPLWVILLASLIRWVSPVWLVRIISFFSLALTFYLCVLIAARTRISELGPLLTNSLKEHHSDDPGVFFSLQCVVALSVFGNFAWISYSGMEAIFWTMLVLASIYLLVREKPAWAGYIILGLSALCRFEAILLIALILLWQMVWARDWKKIIGGGLIAVVLALSFYLYAHFAFGTFFPTTRTGKLASDLFNSGISLKGGWDFLIRHLHYLRIAEPFALAALVFVLIGQVVWVVLERPEKKKIGAFGVSVIFTVLVFLYHDQFFRSTATITPYHNFRYQILFFPALAIAEMLIFAELIWVLEKTWSRAMVSIIFILLIAGSGVWEFSHWGDLYCRQCEHIEDVHIQAAQWARDNTKKDARIGCFDIGSLGYFSDRYVIDLGGLIDPAAHGYLREKRMGPYLKMKQATHYIELGTPGSERLMGIKKDLGNFYDMAQVADFAGQRVPEPVTLHSWEMKIYEIRWVEEIMRFENQRRP